MRLNLPVTDHEFAFPKGETLVSTTDLKGRITYCNPSFILVSGYQREELLGQPHNMIRHPDMPEEAFRDMWDTIASGKPWTAPVKNRRKDGTFYWVQANVTPLMENGHPVGYMSVRTEPSREDVIATDALYRAMAREKEQGTLIHVLRQGRVVRDDTAGRIKEALTPGLSARLALVTTVSTLSAFAAGLFAAGQGVGLHSPWLIAYLLIGVAVAWGVSLRLRPCAGAA